MTAVRTAPDRGVLRDVGWRAGLVLVAAVAVVAGLPAWGRAPLSIAAALAVGAFVVARTRRRGLLDAVLTAVGVGVVLVAMLGLVLNVLPWGLTPAAWAIGTAVIELAALVATAGRRPLGHRVGRRPSARTIGWSLAAAGVLAGALLLSIASFGATHLAPVSLSAGSAGGSTAVTVSAGTEQGPFELDLVTADGTSVLARGLRVGPGEDATVRVTLPAHTRGLVRLVAADGTQPVRELILDTTKASR